MCFESFCIQYDEEAIVDGGGGEGEGYQPHNVFAKYPVFVGRRTMARIDDGIH